MVKKLMSGETHKHLSIITAQSWQIKVSQGLKHLQTALETIENQDNLHFPSTYLELDSTLDNL